MPVCGHFLIINNKATKYSFINKGNKNQDHDILETEEKITKFVILHLTTLCTFYISYSKFTFALVRFCSDQKKPFQNWLKKIK